jgi:hypothetical protein
VRHTADECRLTDSGAGVAVSHPGARAAWQEAVEDLFGSMSRALFTSMNMLFFGSDPELLSKAPYPTLARMHYVFYVSSHPCFLA